MNQSQNNPVFNFVLFFLFNGKIAPPTYAESQYRANIFDKSDPENIQSVNGQNDFAPRYPVYSNEILSTLPKY